MNPHPFEGQSLIVQLADESLEDWVWRLYDAERLSVYRYLASMGVEPDLAKDLTQEAFLKLFVALRQGQRILIPRAWLFTVASRLFLKCRRHESLHMSVRGEAAGRILDRLEDPSAPADTAMIQQRQLAAVADAIKTLSHQQQICLHLRTEGLRYREIADVLGVSVPTVSEFVRRAVARLRRVIDA